MLSDGEVLHDVDFLDKRGGELPQDVAELLEGTGIPAADGEGAVGDVSRGQAGGMSELPVPRGLTAPRHASAHA